MGTWGWDVFANDGASDFLDNHVDELEKHIESLMEEKPFDLHMLGDDELLPCVAMISTLCRHCGAAPPKPENIRRWWKFYLACYAAQSEALGPSDDYRENRPRVVNETFSELLDEASTFWADD
jgi:hypothetical protein